MFCWSFHLDGGPKRGDQAAVAWRYKVYFFGGNGSNETHNMGQIDVHVFTTVSLLWRKLPPVTPGREEGQLEVPSQRWGHTAVLIEDMAYIWGGFNNDRGQYCNNQVHAFDVDTHRWFKPICSGTVPGGRYLHSACVLGKVMFIHVGWNQVTKHFNDLYKVDTTTMVWSLIKTRGTPPRDHQHVRTRTFVSVARLANVRGNIFMLLNIYFG